MKSQIRISVVCDDSKVDFRLKRSTDLDRLMKSYCSRQGSEFRFRYYGTVLKPGDTPETFGMGDNSIIVAEKVENPIVGNPIVGNPTVENQRSNNLNLRNNKIKINVSMNDNTVIFVLKDTTRLEKLMRSFSSRQGIRLDDLVFYYKGKMIHEHNTPLYLSMNNGEYIFVKYR